MIQHKTDVVICGAGIAGLWLFNHLKSLGYDALLLEKNAIGCGQTIASQGIIHSGLKYAFGGQLNTLAKSISAMPDLWRSALKGQGTVNLSAARVSSSSQYLLIPSGFMGGLIGLVAQKALGNNVHDLKKSDWPDSIKQTGFNGSVIFMDEPVLDVGSVLQALAKPYIDNIRHLDITRDIDVVMDEGSIDSITYQGHQIKAERYIFTAAAANAVMAQKLGHDDGLETQHRPLLMGMVGNAPYDLYAHCVGPSDKPVMTITTHHDQNGKRVWYCGGAAAERDKDSNPNLVYDAIRQTLRKYMPDVDQSTLEWSTLPIDRVEGKSKTMGHMPDTPTLHTHGNVIYGWPTKLTFAPLMTQMVMERFTRDHIQPSHSPQDWSFLPPATLTQTPWDEALWTSAA